MKNTFKMLASFLILLLVLFSFQPNAYASVAQIQVNDSTYDYMQFLKEVGEDAIVDTGTSFKITKPEIIKNYINRNYNKIAGIEQYTNLSKEEIYNYIENIIDLKNQSYQAIPDSLNSYNTTISAYATSSIAAGYNYSGVYGHYVKNCWWGISHYFMDKTAMLMYSRDCKDTGNALLAAGLTVSTASAGSLFLPGAAVGVSEWFLITLGNDVEDQSQFYSHLFLDFPVTLVPYKMYA